MYQKQDESEATHRAQGKTSGTQDRLPRSKKRLLGKTS